MARMYGLLSRITDGLDPLRAKFEIHVRNVGLAAVSKVASDAEKLEPKVYVDALLETADALGAALVVATHDPLVAGRLTARWSMTDGRLFVPEGSWACSA